MSGGPVRVMSDEEMSVWQGFELEDDECVRVLSDGVGMSMRLANMRKVSDEFEYIAGE